ncbi:MAG: hypothetical protein ABJE95_27490 [Byssovorax sp.]
MLDTEGRRLLNERLQNTTQIELAKSLEVHQSNVSLWSTGRTRPEPHHREALLVVLGIPTIAWLTPEELEVIARVSKTRDRKRRAA